MTIMCYASITAVNFRWFSVSTMINTRGTYELASTNTIVPLHHHMLSQNRWLYSTVFCLYSTLTTSFRRQSPDNYLQRRKSTAPANSYVDEYVHEWPERLACSQARGPAPMIHYDSHRPLVRIPRESASDDVDARTSDHND